MLDTIKQIRTGPGWRYISPGFMVPPRDILPDAEGLEPEPGNPAVQVRVIRQAVLTELSIVTRPAYSDTGVDVRAWDWPEPEQRRRPTMAVTLTQAQLSGALRLGRYERGNRPKQPDSWPMQRKLSPETRAGCA